MLKKGWKKFKDIVKCVWDFCYLEPNPKESIFHYFLRFFFVPDSSGSPSVTYTLVMIVMVYTGIFLMTDVQLALTKMYEYDATGKIIKEAYKGLSSMSGAIILAYSAAVVFFIKFRGDRLSNQNTPDAPTPTEEDKKDPSLIDTVTNTAKNLLGK